MHQPFVLAEVRRKGTQYLHNNVNGSLEAIAFISGISQHMERPFHQRTTLQHTGVESYVSHPGMQGVQYSFRNAHILGRGTALGIRPRRTQKEGHHPTGRILELPSKLRPSSLICQYESIAAGFLRQQLEKLQGSRHQFRSGRCILRLVVLDAHNPTQDVFNDSIPTHLHCQSRTRHGQSSYQRSVTPESATRSRTPTCVG
mmetsp:Transcript_33706/g.73924  ORF Transcript_33706/g.73924 Transcript_33706/m.73924 type:complete len:201 (+) Transcript_33706:3923-4525(+)